MSKFAGFITVMVIVAVFGALIAWSGARITENLAAQEYAEARIQEARAQQERAIQEARTAIEEARQDNATQRADSRNITLAAIAGMVISQQAGSGNWLFPLALGMAGAWLFKSWWDRQPKG